METFIHLVCIAVASFAITVQPAAAQEANTTDPSPLTYSGRVLQRVDNQTCPSEDQRGIARNKVKTATRRLLRESVIHNLHIDYFCDGSTGWRRVQPTSTCPTHSSSVPLCGGRSPPHTGCVGEDLLVLAVRESTTPLVVNSMTRCVGGSLATSQALQMHFVVLVGQLTVPTQME